jgi:hypothetical protein
MGALALTFVIAIVSFGRETRGAYSKVKKDHQELMFQK